MWGIITLGSVASIYTLYKTGILKWMLNVITDCWDDILDVIVDILSDIDFD